MFVTHLGLSSCNLLLWLPWCDPRRWAPGVEQLNNESSLDGHYHFLCSWLLSAESFLTSFMFPCVSVDCLGLSSCICQLQPPEVLDQHWGQLLNGFAHLAEAWASRCIEKNVCSSSNFDHQCDEEILTIGRFHPISHLYLFAYYSIVFTAELDSSICVLPPLSAAALDFQILQRCQACHSSRPMSWLWIPCDNLSPRALEAFQADSTSGSGNRGSFLSAAIVNLKAKGIILVWMFTWCAESRWSYVTWKHA